MDRGDRRGARQHGARCSTVACRRRYSCTRWSRSGTCAIRRTREHRLHLREAARLRARAERSGRDEAACRARLRRWLAETARSNLGPWLERLAERTGLAFSALQVRGQRTRWGSCSTQRTISSELQPAFLEPPAGALSAHSRAVPYAAYESRRALLGAGRGWSRKPARWTRSSVTPGARSRPGRRGTERARPRAQCRNRSVYRGSPGSTA